MNAEPAEAAMNDDPAITDPALYRVIFENERVRVLEYSDRPGDKTAPHRHPDSVMYTLSSFRRRLSVFRVALGEHVGVAVGGHDG
jgi:hypothetical protein